MKTYVAQRLGIAVLTLFGMSVVIFLLLRLAPGDIVESRGLKQVTDAGAIEKVVDDIIAANPKQVEQVKAKPQTLGWFVGQVMKATGGKANPAAVNEILRRKLGGV